MRKFPYFEMGDLVEHALINLRFKIIVCLRIRCFSYNVVKFYKALPYEVKEINVQSLRFRVKYVFKYRLFELPFV